MMSSSFARFIKKTECNNNGASSNNNGSNDNDNNAYSPRSRMGRGGSKLAAFNCSGSGNCNCI